MYASRAQKLNQTTLLLSLTKLLFSQAEQITTFPVVKSKTYSQTPALRCQALARPDAVQIVINPTFNAINNRGTLYPFVE